MFYANTPCRSVHFLLVARIYRITQIFISKKSSIFVNFFVSLFRRRFLKKRKIVTQKRQIVAQETKSRINNLLKIVWHERAERKSETKKTGKRNCLRQYLCSRIIPLPFTMACINMWILCCYSVEQKPIFNLFSFSILPVYLNLEHFLKANSTCISKKLTSQDQENAFESLSKIHWHSRWNPNICERLNYR